MIKEQPRIVFIGGTGRSATGVTKEVLGNHPEVASLPFETRLIIDPDSLVEYYATYPIIWSPYMADRKLKRLENFLNQVAGESRVDRLTGKFLRLLDRDGRIMSPRRYHGWNLQEHIPDFKRFCNDLLDELREFSYPGSWVGMESYTFRPRLYFAPTKSKEELAEVFGKFIDRVISSLLAKQRKSVLVEDSNWNILFAGELLEMVPQAKILHVYRDPRDVVTSFSQQRWTPSDVGQAAIWYSSLMSHWLSVRPTIPEVSLFEFRVEDLVSSPEEMLMEICTFIGIPYNPVLLQTELTDSSHGRWKRDLTPEDQQKVSGILADLIERLGYAI